MQMRHDPLGALRTGAPLRMGIVKQSQENVTECLLPPKRAIELCSKEDLETAAQLSFRPLRRWPACLR
jgi:hypothetical protein